MSETPRLQSIKTDEYGEYLTTHPPYLDGTPLTDEESEVAAVTIALFRLDMMLRHDPISGDFWVEDADGGVVRRMKYFTPAEAYEAARAVTRDEES